MRRIVVLLVIAGCSKSERAKPAKADEPRGPAKPAPSKKSSADMPTWASLDLAGGPAATPTAWATDGRPTLAVFSASWCPGCTASALADRELVRTHGKDMQIGVALQDESDEAFAKSKYAQALSGVPVWSEASAAKLTEACHPVAIPSACLFEKGKVRWMGDPTEAGAVIEAHKAGKLDAWLADADSAEEKARTEAQQALEDETKIPGVVAMTHGRAGWQNSIAWNLVDRDKVSPGAAALAVALSRDAVAADGGVDFAHLDTYALALHKAGRVQDAAYVGARVIAVCDAIQGNCSEERHRAQDFIARSATN